MQRLTSNHRFVMRLLVVCLVLLSVATVTVTTTTLRAPTAQGHALATCSWHTVAGPVTGATYNGAQVKAWLFAYEYDTTLAYCGMLHSSIDWSQQSGYCNTFNTEVYQNSTGAGWQHTSTFSCASSGSLQSSFLSISTVDCWRGAGFIGSVLSNGEALTGCYYN